MFREWFTPLPFWLPGVTGGMGKGAQKVSRIESFVERVSKTNYTTSAAVRATEQTMRAD